MGEKKKLIVLIGPTAVGKTKLSIELAKKVNGEIISGDSMQIYKQLDIGTAKIHKNEMDGIPHYLIDIKEPTESFSVADFQREVRMLIDEITSRGKVPMIVGGTGLYIQSVLYDYQFSESGGNEEIRNQLEGLLEEKGEEHLFSMLQKVDQKSAETIHPNNVRRVMRALEVFESTGKTFSSFTENQHNELLYEVAMVGLTMDRKKLYERINRRVDMMMDSGLINEVKTLYDGNIRNCQSVQAIGYKELFDYFEGKTSLETAIELIKQNSRRYAKRQLTWFRNKMDVTWFDMTEPLDEKLDQIFDFVAGKLELEANNNHYRDKRRKKNETND
ncbi:tRNA (adenosine(37)-N6)-dimethylallyltransferase MiaA [Bacillus alkalisoli]|uniref:tRNA (adenosine(37)-N6)-dimethylallyltransferase MiaA n=1 Tax=Bacillus alkalisoli TaxID=2011008 RepID=UPI000C243DCB|nr:tRNA (adenosine(37)-N6)-dimethylallyltransferase MiaA [Bacillus alkalisoli]